jgi:uncharacterized protein
MEELWEQVSSRESASQKPWMDAYLAAFAIKSECSLVTLDQDFHQFESSQLRLKLLGSP